MDEFKERAKPVPRTLTPEAIEKEAAEVGRLQKEVKYRGMVYQVELKEELAKRHGKPLNAYYDLPYKSWEKMRDEAFERPKANKL